MGVRVKLWRKRGEKVLRAYALKLGRYRGWMNYAAMQTWYFVAQLLLWKPRLVLDIVTSPGMTEFINVIDNFAFYFQLIDCILQFINKKS